MKRLVLWVGILGFVLLAGPALATNGYQLIGVGQMQKGMGGAVTAAPMDTMTAITNPAGMARVGERADFSMEAFMPTRSVDFSGTGGGSTEGGSDLYGIPSVGWLANAFGRENFYFGGGMFATSGMGVDYDEIVMTPAGSPLGNATDITFDGYSSVAFWKMAPTVAWNHSDRTSFGVSLNVDYQSLTFRQQIRDIIPPLGGPDPGDVVFDLGRPTSQLGYGFTVGALHDLSDRVTVGFNYASKQVFGDGEFRLGTGDILNYNGATGLPGVYELGLDFPQQAAVGIAFAPDDRLLVDFDIKWINWSDTHDQVSLSGPANSFGAGVSATTLGFGWDDQVVYALGLRYRATDTLTLRAGYNYGESPIGPEDVLNNIIFPAIVERHLALGFDYKLDKHWGVGGAYMRAFEKSLTGKGDTGGFASLLGGSPDSNVKIALEETSIGLLLYYLID